MKNLRYWIFFALLFSFIPHTFSVTSNLLTEENKKALFFETIEKKIITRAEWWADENYRYLNSNEWKDIIKKQETLSKNLTQKQIEANEKEQKKKNGIYAYINKYFNQDNAIVQKISFEWVNELARPVEKTEYVKSIVLHHTADEYKDSYGWIKAIYRYHSLSRQWGDIGYNYIIWYNGEIFEWRAWGDYVVWAHALWNNRSTVGISVMWNYSKKPISEKQYIALKNLVRYLAYKYGINMNDTFPLHEECSWKNCPLWIKTEDYYPLSGHRDGGNTSCPWDELYKKMLQIRKDLQYETMYYKPIKNSWMEGN